MSGPGAAFADGDDTLASDAERADWHAVVTPKVMAVSAASLSATPASAHFELGRPAPLLSRIARTRYRIGAVLFHFRGEDSQPRTLVMEIADLGPLLVGRGGIDYATPRGRGAALGLPTRSEFATSPDPT